MITTIKSLKQTENGIIPVTIEVTITAGIGIHVIGLVDQDVKESLLRTITAMQSMGFCIPSGKIVINIVPLDLKKTKGQYDLPIALGILASSGQVELPVMNDFLLAGQLKLDGTIRAFDDVNDVIDFAKKNGYKSCIVPLESIPEIQKTDVYIYFVKNLQDVIEVLSNTGNKQQ